MIFRPNNRTRNRGAKSLKIFGALTALLLAIFLLSRSSSSGALSRGAENIAAPIWRAGASVRGEGPGFFSFFSAKEALISQNQEREAENKKLKANLIGYDAALREILDLRTLLHRDPAAQDIVLAGVLARSSDLPFDTLHIDAGKNFNIGYGDIVIAGAPNENETASTSSLSSNLIAVGSVMEVTRSASKVKLFSSAGEKTQVFLGPENLSVTLAGAGGGTMSVELPKDADVKAGDTALLPGVSGNIVAVVHALEPDPTLSFVTVYLRLPVNPRELRYVGIVRTQQTDTKNE